MIIPKLFSKTRRQSWDCLYHLESKMLFLFLCKSLDEHFLTCLLHCLIFFHGCELSINTLQRDTFFHKLAQNTDVPVPIFLTHLLGGSGGIRAPADRVHSYLVLIFRFPHTGDSREHAHPAGGPCRCHGQR